MSEKKKKDQVITAVLIVICCIGVLLAVRPSMEGARPWKKDVGMCLGNYISRISETIHGEPHVIEDFEVVYQLPQLQTGCEVTSLTMVLNYCGYPTSKTALAKDYLPKTSYRLTWQDGKAYGPDLDAVFVGNPFGDGTICGPEAIVTTANAYLEDAFVENVIAKDITGTTPAGLYLRVSNGQPVMIYVTIGMANRDDTLGWYTMDGKYVDWSLNDHGSVLIGWDEESVTIACPLTGIQTCSRVQFERIYAQRGYRAAVLEAVSE